MFNTMDRLNSKQASNGQLVAIYTAFLGGSYAVFRLVAEGEFSFVLTLGAIMQCLAFALLAVQVMTSGTAGISTRSLALDAFALCCKLSSTTWLAGYLPFDASGDYIYQVVDGLSLIMVFWVLHRVVTEKRLATDDVDDNFPAVHVAVGALVLGALLKADLNDSPVFDGLWLTSVFAGAVSVLPQLWLMMKTRGPVEPLTSHFIAAMAVGRFFSGIYMWHARDEITPSVMYIGNFNHSGWAIVVAHALHLILLADFAWFYGKTVAQNGLNSRMEMPEDFYV